MLPDGWNAGYSITLTNGVEFSRELTRDLSRRGLITAITNSVDGIAINLLAYNYDKLNRATGRNTDAFGYNARSEVTNATLNAIDYSYSYDNIGNHTASSVDSAATTYTANALNQYTSILCAPAPLREPSYDSDGNPTTNGVWSYAWDAENRLVAAYSNSVCIVSNAYDHASRRVAKWTPDYTTTFVYDGWNLVQETIQNQQSTITNHYVWGKDLSGTMQGAGGVDGLLAVSLNGTWYFPFFDANGNITAYIDEQGSIVAVYAYDAFGGTISQSGSMADAFPHRFSTKYFDSETGFYYYGYRFYDPVLHRWMNRDPIEEQGGLNLYAFCGNDGVNLVDLLGMAKFYVYFVGDSLTHGHNDIGKNMDPQDEGGRYDGYKHMLMEDLKKKYSKHHDFEFGGIGMPGRTIKQLSDDLRDSNKGIPDKCNGIIILFLAGMNNMPVSGATSDIDTRVDSAFAGWTTLRDNTVAQIGSSEYQRLFLAMTLPSVTTSKDKEDKAYWRRNYAISLFNSKILPTTLSSPNLKYKVVQLGEKKSGKYIGNNGQVVKYDLHEVGNHIKDGLHYTDEGNRLIVNKLLTEIKPWIMDKTLFTRKRSR